MCIFIGNRILALNLNLSYESIMEAALPQACIMQWFNKYFILDLLNEIKCYKLFLFLLSASRETGFVCYPGCECVSITITWAAGFVANVSHPCYMLTSAGDEMAKTQCTDKIPKALIL